MAAGGMFPCRDATFSSFAKRILRYAGYSSTVFAPPRFRRASISEYARPNEGGLIHLPTRTSATTRVAHFRRWAISVGF